MVVILIITALYNEQLINTIKKIKKCRQC